MGKPHRHAEPGLHKRLPWPFETVWKHDNRIRCLVGTIGEFEEVFTKDRKNIIITAYLCWGLDNSSEQILKYLQRVKNIDDAEEKLTHILRSYRSAIIGEYSFHELVNSAPKMVKIEEIENRILESTRNVAREQFGIQINDVGIKHIGLPQTVTQSVFSRMRAERESEKEEILAKGEAEARKIRAKADSERRILLAEAKSKAKRIQGEADAKAAEYFEIFKEDPFLAEFLVEIEALKKVSDGATLFFNPDIPPFTALKKLQGVGQETNDAPSKSTITGTHHTRNNDGVDFYTDAVPIEKKKPDSKNGL